jgi:hypothetical protein
MASQATKNKLLASVVSEVIKSLSITDIISMYNIGDRKWEDIFANALDQQARVDVFADAVKAAGVSNDDLDELFQPYFAREIQTALNNSGTRAKVSIRW